MIYYLNLEGIEAVLTDIFSTPEKLVMFIACIGLSALIGDAIFNRPKSDKDID